MAPLTQTLALLAMTVATAAIEVKHLNMAPDSFDDQYEGCRNKMTEKLPALMHSEFQWNKELSQGWVMATAEWQARGSHVSPLLSSDQAIALLVYTNKDTGVYEVFNPAVREAGRSRQAYHKQFHFKSLHFLLTDALATQRSPQQCHSVYRGDSKYRFDVQRGDIIRFGQFTSTSLNKAVAQSYGTVTMFQVYTCQGVDIQGFSHDKSEQEVLIPPFETFEVINVSQEGDKTQIQLHSTGKHSNYSCELLTGGSIARETPLLGGLLLATAAMAVATLTL